MESTLTAMERLSRKSLEVERLERENAELKARLAVSDAQVQARETDAERKMRGWMETANDTMEHQKASIGSLCDALQRQITANENMKARIEYIKAQRATRNNGVWNTSALAVSAALGAVVAAAIMALI